MASPLFPQAVEQLPGSIAGTVGKAVSDAAPSGGLFAAVAGEVGAHIAGNVAGNVLNKVENKVIQGIGGAESAQLAGRVIKAAETLLPSTKGQAVKGAPGPSDLQAAEARGKVASIKNLPPLPQATQWGNLSKFLLLRILPCTRKGVPIPSDTEVIFCPITDSNLDAAFNWVSPFDGISPESKAPTLMAMLQTGQLEDVANALMEVAPKPLLDLGLQSALDDTKSTLDSLIGKTGITKLNSRLVFNGSPPLKLTCTLHFRAYSNPQTEVMGPYMRLMQWAPAQKIANTGQAAQLIRNATSVSGALNGMFPSDAPTMVSLVYGNMAFPPMVIEHISHPIDQHIGANGLPTYLAVNVTFATLDALDATDFKNVFNVTRGILS